MKKLVATAALTLSLVTLAVSAHAAGDGVPAMIAASQATVQAQVTAIDLAARKVTLKAADGRLVTVPAGPEIKNLDKVKVGDTVAAQYSQALTIALKKGGGMREKEVSTDSARAAAGQKPGVAAMREVHFVADITKLDAKTGAMTVKGAEGRMFDLTIKDTAALKGFQAGDQVEGTYLQVLAIGVVPPPAKK
jgi:Cu/Ag efflux protein CusF